MRCSAVLDVPAVDVDKVIVVTVPEICVLQLGLCNEVGPDIRYIAFVVDERVKRIIATTILSHKIGGTLALAKFIPVLEKILKTFQRPVEDAAGLGPELVSEV